MTNSVVGWEVLLAVLVFTTGIILVYIRESAVIVTSFNGMMEEQEGGINMIIDMTQQSMLSPLDSPIWQMGTPPVGTSQRQGVGGLVEDVQVVTGNAGTPTGATVSVTGSVQNLPI